jgi:hypothetical protein
MFKDIALGLTLLAFAYLFLANAVLVIARFAKADDLARWVIRFSAPIARLFRVGNPPRENAAH